MVSKKSLALGIVAALALGASGVASATIVNVDGVVFDTADPFNITMQAVNFRESSVSNVGDVLHGYGQVATINNNFSNTGVLPFCPSCELTFTFQYTVSNIYTGGSQPQVVFDLGSVQFYVQAPGSFSVSNPNSAIGGTPWLTLAGHTAPNGGFTQPGQIGQLYSNINGTITNPQSNSSGAGLMDAVGGDAAPYFNTNTIDAGTFDGINYGFADFNFTSAFLADGINICQDGICYPINGSGTLKGFAVAVPEPGALGMLGLGMGVLGLFFWRRRKEAEDRA